MLPIAAVSPKAEPLIGYLTNSIFVGLIVAGLVIFFVWRATRNIRLVPGKKQNFVEFIIEFLYGQVEGIVGAKVAPRVFPFLCTLFIFILVSNWFGLIPGVGTIGLTEHPGAFMSAHHLDTPLLRPATADMNLTVGMALIFMVLWVWWTLTELGEHETHGKGSQLTQAGMGIWGFIKHTFAPKGGLKGAILFVLVPIFLFVGVIEIISIVFRPVSLSLRLFGNLFAGESLLHSMAVLGKDWGPVLSFLSKIVLPLPFYFLELLVGVLQATVFTLLCAVYIQLSTSHEEEH